MKGHLGPPSSIGAAPLPAEVIAVLKAEMAKPGMSGDKLRKRIVPPPAGATFWRAVNGEKVSKPVQAACAEYARSARDTEPDAKPYDFDPDPDPEAA